jgi:glycosyltransferase involved in cell wall biosynthesis
MAGLALGKAVVTTVGHLTEVEWAGSGAVELVPLGDVAAMSQVVTSLLASPDKRVALGDRARTWYDAHFSIQRTIAVLRPAVAYPTSTPAQR